MSIRWRKNGLLVCAAMSEHEEGDTYIDDRLHYQLSVISRSIMADVDHENNGLWWWVHDDIFLRATPEKIAGTAENWENGKLGCDERFAKISDTEIFLPKDGAKKE